MATVYACNHSTITPWPTCPQCGAPPSTERCTCGSGGHPRYCLLHPERFEEHCKGLEAAAEWDNLVRIELRAYVAAFLERHPGMRQEVALDLLRDAIAVADTTGTADGGAPTNLTRAYTALQEELRLERGKAWEAWARLSTVQEWFESVTTPRFSDIVGAYVADGRATITMRLTPNAAMAYVVAGLAHLLDEKRATNCVEAVMEWEGAPLLVEVRRKGKKTMAQLRTEAQGMARTGAAIWLTTMTHPLLQEAVSSYDEMTAWAKGVLAELGPVPVHDTAPAPPPTGETP